MNQKATPGAAPTMIKPRRLRIDASTLCQLRCATCPTASSDFKKAIGIGYLRFDNFRRLVDENPHLKEIELSNFGEILLNPDLPLIAEFACKHAIRLRADNGVNLNTATDTQLEALVRYRFRAITCSIDGASQETYSQYRVNGDYETVIANLQKINALKRKLKTNLPRLTWQFVVFGHNEHEIAAARLKAQELGMEFRPKLNWDDTYSPIRDRERVRQMTGLSAVTRKDFENNYGIGYLQSTCHQLWDDPQINWDGKVLGCCWNYWQEFGGNAFGDNIDTCVNGEKISYARAMLQGHVAMRKDIPCSICENYLAMTKSGHYLSRGLRHHIIRAIRNLSKVPLAAHMKSKLQGPLRAMILRIARFSSLG